MTDQLQKYTDDRAGRLSLHAERPGMIVVAASKPSPASLVGSQKRTGAIVAVPTSRLLAMIDTIDPGAMRAYLRETVPEADSPEDVDEQPDPVEQMRESGRQLGEAWRALSHAFRDASKGNVR